MPKTTVADKVDTAQARIILGGANGPVSRQRLAQLRGATPPRLAPVPLDPARPSAPVRSYYYLRHDVERVAAELRAIGRKGGRPRKVA